MSTLKRWIALAAVAAVAVLAAGWFLLVSPKHAEAADLRRQAADNDRATSALVSQLQVLKAQAKDLPEEQAKLAKVATQLPAVPAQPALLRALAAAADGADLDFVSITPGALTPVVAAAPAAAAAGTATATAIAATGLLAMPVSINVAGGYYQLEQYLAALEDLPRALRVTGLTVAPGTSPTTPTGASTTDGQHLLLSITGTVFVAPTTAIASTAATTTPATASAAVGVS